MERKNKAQLLASHLQGLEAQIESIEDDANIQQLCASFLDDAIAGMADLKNTTSADTHPQIDSLGLSFAMLATCLTAHFTLKIGEMKKSRSRDAEIKKSTHDLIVSVAQAIAVRAWEIDIDQKIRIGEMSEKVWAEMIDSGFESFLPDKAKRLQDWIAPIAPGYARGPGRPRKTPYL